MEPPDWYGPQMQWVVHVPQRLDGSGCVALRMSVEGMKRFGLDKFPRPDDYGSPNPNGEGRVVYITRKRGGANQGSFRLAYGWREGTEKPLMVRFRLGSNWRMETLHVITNYLMENYEGWFEIRNDHGNNVWKGFFSSDVARLRGTACS